MKKETFLNMIDELMLKASLTDKLEKVSMNKYGYVTYKIDCHIPNYAHSYKIEISFNTQAPNLCLYVNVKEMYSGYTYAYSKVLGYPYRESITGKCLNISDSTYYKHFKEAYNNGMELFNFKLKHQERMNNQEGNLNMNNQEFNNMNTEQFKNYYNQLSYDEIKEEAKKLDLNECLEFISELIFDYDIGLGLTYDQIKTIYENYLNESDVKEFCFKMKYYNEEELETELITDQLGLFNLDLLTTDQIYIYENAEEFIDMYIDNYGQEVRDFYDRIIRYVINENALYDYLTQYDDFIKTESGQILEIIY